VAWRNGNVEANGWRTIVLIGLNGWLGVAQQWQYGGGNGILTIKLIRRNRMWQRRINGVIGGVKRPGEEARMS